MMVLLLEIAHLWTGDRAGQDTTGQDGNIELQPANPTAAKEVPSKVGGRQLHAVHISEPQLISITAYQVQPVI